MTTPSARLSTALADRYRIERELGAGGMASVYLAEDLKHKRKVALKVLKPELAAVIGATRFLAEISTTANLQHPHLLPLHDSGEVDGTAYYVMPFVEGESLRDRLNREKQLPVADAVRIATEVAGALDYAHRKGIIHRDIKPENILLHDGRALIADFGIALAASRSDSSSRLTETGMSLGTPHYMSPEQAMGERTLDGRADVYALGCVLYEMLTGEPPFSGPTAQAIVAKVMSAEPVPVEELRKTVPAHVAAAVHAALQKIPADRFATAADLAAALQDPARAPTLIRARATPARRSPLLVVAPWVVAAAAIALFVVKPGLGDPKPGGTRPVRFSIPAAGARPNDRPAISPDGRFIVYPATQGSVTRFYRRFLDATESIPLIGTEGAQFPAISPDGRWLAYVGADFNVYKRPFDGGPPIRVARTPNPPNGLAWSRAHGIVLGMRAFTANPGLSVTADSAESMPRLLTTPSTNMHHDPFIPEGGDIVLFQNFEDFRLGVAHLPDGRFTLLDLRIRVIVGYAGGVLLYIDPEYALMAVGFDPRAGTLTSQPVPVGSTPRGLRSAAMSADGALVMQVEPDAFRLEVVDEQGVGTPLFPDTLIDVNARYSPDGTRVALAMTTRESNGVQVYDLRTRTLSRLAPFRRAVSRIEWSPDGTRVVVSGLGSSEIDWFAADASDQPSVLYTVPDSVKAFWASLTPDGRELILGTNLGTGAANISVVRLEGDSALKPLVASDANEVAPRLSPNGRWLAYASDESGQNQVYVRPYPGPGPRVQLSDEGGTQPMWSRNGQQLFYRIGDALMSVDVRADPTSVQLLGTNRRKLFEGKFLGNDWIRIVSLYDVAPDGKHFLFARALEGSRSEIVVWLNWLDEVKARLGTARR